ncbi:MAG: hypothetical protein ACON5C_00075 [Alphaproteobacteria bacterium]
MKFLTVLNDETNRDIVALTGATIGILIGFIIVVGFKWHEDFTQKDLLAARYYAIFDEVYFSGKELSAFNTCEMMLSIARDNSTQDMVPSVGFYSVFELENGVVSSTYHVQFSYNDCNVFFNTQSETNADVCASFDQYVLPELEIVQTSRLGLVTVVKAAGAITTYDFSDLQSGEVNYSYVGLNGEEHSLVGLVCVQP